MAATTGGAVAESALTGTLLGSAKLFAIGKVVGFTVAVGAAGVGGYEWVASTSGAHVNTMPSTSITRPAPLKARNPVVAKPAMLEPPRDSTQESGQNSTLPQAVTPTGRAAERAVSSTPNEQPVGEAAPSEREVRALSAVGAFPSDTPNLAAEARGLARAQAALREGNAAQALSLLDQQKAQFAGGALEEERAAARVFALCNAGLIQEANTAAAEFLMRSPRSVLAERVAKACPRRK
jgi:hypothetical protein